MIHELVGVYEGLQINKVQATVCASLQKWWQSGRQKKWHGHPCSNLCQICVKVPRTPLPPFPSLTAQWQGLSFSHLWWLGASQFARTNPHVKYHLKCPSR